MKKYIIKQEDKDSLFRKISDYFETNNFSWRGSTNLPFLNEREFYVLCFDNDFDKRICNSVRYYNWYGKSIVKDYISHTYLNFADDILENPKKATSKALFAVIELGIISSISQIDKLVESSDPDVRLYASKICSFKALDTLSKDSVKKVRKAAFERLGPVSHLDLMLKDKYADIRMMGVEFAPLNYPALSDMKNEISGKVFRLLLTKIRKDDLPMLLANRNLKDKYISSIFQSRIESGL